MENKKRGMGRGAWTLALALGALACAGAEFTVKPGDDVRAVRDRIRAERAAGTIASNESVTVTFEPGDYRFTESLVLDARDSGTASAPVVWRAAKPKTVRILGGSVIPRDAFRPVSDAARARLDPSVADKVLAADVSKLLAKDPKPWADGPANGLMPGPWLYVGGESQTLARWPNADAPDGGWYGYSNVLESCGYEVDKRTKKPAVIEFPGDRAERWRFDEGVWFMGYFVVDWDCDLQRIASYDKATHGARFASCKTHYGVGKGGWPFFKRRFCAVNLLEELDAPGEWYYDRKGRTLYWYPGAQSGEIVLAQDLVPFVRIEKASFVRLENLFFGFAHGERPSVWLQGARDCTVANCDFECLSYHAVDVAGGCRNRVSDCRMTKLGTTAVDVSGGDRKNLLPANNLVERCAITRNGLYQRAHSNAFRLSGCGNAIRDCKVSDAPEGAISYSGNEHLIADNDFGNIVLEVGDAGAIYSGHHADWLGTVLFGNYIHHLAKTELEELSRSGIYFDDCDWGDDSIGNTLVHCGMGFLLGGGKLHGFYNNLIVGCARAFAVSARGHEWRMGERGSFWWAKTGRTFAEYRHDESGIDPDRAPWCVAYPALREAMDNRPEYPLMNEFRGNELRNCRKAVSTYDAARRLIDHSLPGNTIVTNSTDTSLVAPQPIRLKDAVENVLKSEDGATAARIALDASAHLSWTLAVDGRTILAPSPLGITVGYFDYGHKVVPGAAEDGGAVSLASFTNGTFQTTLKQGVAVRNARTNLVAFASLTARAWRIPVRSLITGKTVASLDVRVWKGGAAYRWTVPVAGACKVYGENDAFIPADGRRASIVPVEWERDRDFKNGYAESLYYERGTGWGVMFPEFEHGWPHEGPVVSPWRGVLIAR